MINVDHVTFRKLTLDDLELIYRWLNQPYVHEWYDKDKENTIEEITERYGPKIKGEKPTDCYLCLYEDKPVGYLQTYRVNDWPEFGDYLNYDDSVASVDLFIGDQEFVGTGFGSLMLKLFLQKVVFIQPNIFMCIIGPEPGNKRAICAYEKVGFKHNQTVRIGDEPDLTYIMELKKEDL